MPPVGDSICLVAEFEVIEPHSLTNMLRRGPGFRLECVYVCGARTFANQLSAHTEISTPVSMLSPVKGEAWGEHACL